MDTYPRLVCLGAFVYSTDPSLGRPRGKSEAAQIGHMSDTLLSRFLRYVRINTQSDASTGTSPSTAGQWVLLRMLESELLEMGATNVVLTEFGYLMATVPATSTKPGVPTVAVLGTLGTAPEV